MREPSSTQRDAYCVTYKKYKIKKDIPHCTEQLVGTAAAGALPLLCDTSCLFLALLASPTLLLCQSVLCWSWPGGSAALLEDKERTFA